MKKLKILILLFIFLVSCSSINKEPEEYNKVGIKTTCKKQVSYGFWDFIGDMIGLAIDKNDKTLFSNDVKYEECLTNEKQTITNYAK